MFDFNLLPNIMYFGASKEYKELKGQVFLTPYLGIASLFIIDTSDLFPKGYDVMCNLDYEEWYYDKRLLLNPLINTTVTHNISEWKNEIFTGHYSGYIHVIDISHIKDKIALYNTNDPEREVVYNGDISLKIIDVIPHTINWSFKYSIDNFIKNGFGKIIKSS